MLSTSTHTDSSSVFKKEHIALSEEKGVSEESILDEKFIRRTIRKVDLRLLPILGATYAFSLIDRSNLPNVLVSGADRDIKLSKGNHYSLATLVFFIPYIVLELPSNMIFRRVGASRYLGTIGFLWGVIMLCMGFVTTWNQMAALRGLLGILEAGFFPACVWLISCWYTRMEVQVRLAAFYLTSVLAGAFSNILAYELSTIKYGRLSGWRWILIVEGMITCLLSFLGYFLIVDFPDKNKFLTAQETAAIKERVERDRGDGEHDPLTWRKALEYCCDLKLWSFAMCFLCTTTVAYAYSYFTQIILIGLGFSVKNSQLLFAPEKFSSSLFAFGVSKLADRYQLRGPFIIFQSLVTILGLGLTAFHPNDKVRFAGIFIGSAGAQGNIPALLAYQANNVRRQSKRSFSVALQIGFGGIGGIVSALVYRQQDAPSYRPGILTTIALQGLIVVLVVLNTLWFLYRNHQARNGGKPIEGQPGFLYTI